MESMQTIRARIQGIGSTRQITQSMRLVSTAKVQRCRGRMQDNVPFLTELRRLAWQVSGGFSSVRHPYIVGNPGVETAAVVAIGSDRGLCGGYNIGVGKETMELLAELGEARLVTVGSKVRDFLKRRRIVAAETFTGISENPFFDDAMEIAAVVLHWFNSGQVGAVHMVHTRFETLLLQTPLRVQLLPLAAESFADLGELGRAPRCEPGGMEFLERLVPQLLGSWIYGAMLEASACEQSARITSMDSAVKNADEMMAALTQRYNQARQGAITQEITEIVGGADALTSREE